MAKTSTTFTPQLKAQLVPTKENKVGRKGRRLTKMGQALQIQQQQSRKSVLVQQNDLEEVQIQSMPTLPRIRPNARSQSQVANFDAPLFGAVQSKSVERIESVEEIPEDGNDLRLSKTLNQGNVPILKPQQQRNSGAKIANIQTQSSMESLDLDKQLSVESIPSPTKNSVALSS